MTGAVRRATTDDAWAIHETARASWHAAYDDILGPGTVDEVVDEWYALGDLESSITDVIGRDDAEFLVVEPDDSDGGPEECRGFAHAVPWPEDDSVAYVARFYVRPDAWGEGVGTTLLERLEALLADSFDRVRLAVLADNDIGISFAESSGYERVAVRETGLGDELEEFVYEKAI
ncbi:GNAT family N-acetyltransferase [Halopiger aswanensis]|uniref:Acetyltransferase (GNAT) family protein n=1 Tax=Halopiger aswanensis TaxID=148449 RepID=A0A419WS70_9EURY|nr:GNAT family N-acetyltransferase [Halopiger aswanensis]RKD98361.1 acetyltransferase (GNAT) family protein [Halopiger aswanensis]